MHVWSNLADLSLKHFAVKKQGCILRVFSQVYVTVDDINMLSDAQQRSYGKFTSKAAMQITRIRFWRK